MGFYNGLKISVFSFLFTFIISHNKKGKQYFLSKKGFTKNILSNLKKKKNAQFIASEE